MEKRFCGKCGKPVAMCICDDTTNKGMKKARFGDKHSKEENVERTSEYYLQQFDQIVLGGGEQIVRKYHIGTMKVGGLIFPEKTLGNSYILVTNKRVISKADYNNGELTGTSLEEISIDTISGVKSQYTHDVVIWKVFAVLALGFCALGNFIGSCMSWRYSAAQALIKLLFSALCGVVAYVFYRRRKKPGYVFSIHSSATGEALVVGAGGDEVTGIIRAVLSLLNPQSGSILMKYTPTTEAVTMMRELGACIMDIKAKGDYAVEIWKKE